MINSTDPLSKRIVLADWTRKKEDNPIVELLSLAARPGVISFALGLPAADLFPLRAYQQAAEHVLLTDEHALQYGVPIRQLKTQIVNLMAGRGVKCDEDQVSLTTGAQQGMALAARLLLNRGSKVICEETIYSGFQQVIEPFQPEIITVPTDADTGIDVEAVSSVLAESGDQIAFIYTIPDGHNPLGVTLSQDKRRLLAELAGRYGVPIIEDDAYGFLNYHDEPLPPIRALNDQWVFYIGTFSKILAPGLRVGWIISPHKLSAKLSVVKESIDIDTGSFTQRTISAYLGMNDIAAHITRLRWEYGLRRDMMLSALAKYFPHGAAWGIPESGFFVWVSLPPETNTESLLKASIERMQVAFIPGHFFSVSNEGAASHSFRLSFSNSPPPLIEEGVKRLSQIVDKHIYNGRCFGLT